MSNDLTDIFDFVSVFPDRVSKRVSSWDQTGGNRDRIMLESGQTRCLLDVKGPGRITHIWMALNSLNNHPYRTGLVKMFWDGEEFPSVLVPVGDFFGVGHTMTTNYSSLPMVMAPSEGRGMSCYLPMFFSDGARIIFDFESGSDLELYYSINYELWEEIPEGVGRFHACWHRENPTDGIFEPAQMEDNIYRSAGKNTSDSGNFKILEAEGMGQYIGCNLNIHALRYGKGGGNWYGEGDEMIFIDDDNEGKRWPPTLHGTGTEDYFNTAWAPSDKFSSPFFGLTLPGGKNFTGFISWYRWHLPDPIRFSKSINVSMEHGHANRRSDDFSCTAYWYQIEPHRPFDILPFPERMPRVDFPEIPNG
jgi:hypothetical protein